MAGGIQQPRSDNNSVKYKCNLHKGSSSELSDFDHEVHALSSTSNSEHTGKKSEYKSCEILSTAEFISTVGQMWKRASYPLSVLQRKQSLRHNDHDLKKEAVVCYAAGDGNCEACSSTENQYFSISLANNSPYTFRTPSNVECLEVNGLTFQHANGRHTHTSLWRLLHGSCNMLNATLKERELASIGISSDLGSIYGWMSNISPAINSAHVRERRISDSISENSISPAGCCVSGNTTSTPDNLVMGTAELHTTVIEPLNSLSNQNEESRLNLGPSVASLCSNYDTRDVQEIVESDSASRTSDLHTGYHTDLTASGSCATEEWIYDTKDNPCKNGKHQEKEIADKSEVEICSSIQNTPRYALGKQEHAFAGAMAGIFVSVCLHPVDTIKTVIQSCHSDQKRICFIGRRIISERGVTGLYRGIASNIASSAPISAIYTFTYESVKAILLPLFPKDYQSLAHCMAGGCASFATSFIFTPSERIKQQMQVGSHYQNCWNALIGIIAKGGLPSLYAGWGAVLCRNVPHSIIKFYTYESLKPFMLSTLQSNAQPNPLHTLVCGGLAGSTAALFTTPFDVVKTRMQTQIPGSVNHYHGVFETLKYISRHEGLNGLYRGLTPRLIMYMTQGALFFASYESFKKLLSLELPQLN